MTTLPGPDCGIGHDYDCRRYVLVHIGAAVRAARSWPILVAALPGAVR
jgi:hypothetical protein